MNTAINLLSVIPMRKEPSHRSEMVSQLLFGEYAEVLEEEKDFVRIKCLYDGYEGWVQATQLTTIKEDQILTTNKYIGITQDEVFINGRCNNVPFCSPIYYADKQGQDLFFGKISVRYIIFEKAVWNVSDKKFNQKNLSHILWIFDRAPYLWGGKSIFGIDCSGFVQQVFKMFGIKLLRDAYLQATQGELVKNLEESKLGDLAFFQNENGKITHVGIILEGNQIVHASGKVKIDTIDKEGIINSENKKRTHQLHSIRRMIL